jgi:hypothetical protein
MRPDPGGDRGGLSQLPALVWHLGSSLTEETEAVVKKSLPKDAIVVPSRPPNQIINPPDKVSGFPHRT